MRYFLQILVGVGFIFSCTVQREKKKAIDNLVNYTHSGQPVYLVVNVAYDKEPSFKVLVSNDILYSCCYAENTVFDQDFADTLRKILYQKNWRPLRHVYNQMKSFSIDTALYYKLNQNYTPEAVYLTYFDTLTWTPNENFTYSDIQAATAFLIDHHYFAYRDCYSGYIMMNPIVRHPRRLKKHQLTD